MTERITFWNGEIDMTGNLFFPEDFDGTKKYPAIIIGHPAGGVKEQAAGLYALKMAEKGYVALAFDANYQGKRNSSPGHTTNLACRVGDISTAIDFLTTLPYVDGARIGGIGICASAGYLVTAAKTEKRIKVLAIVSGVDLTDLSGLMNFRAFDQFETLLTQPVLVIAGSEANSKWNSGILFDNAANSNKEYCIVEGARHPDLYDIPKYVDQGIEKITRFFGDYL